MADKQANREEDVPDFAAQLATVRPTANVELGEELRALIQKVKDTGKPGTLSYTMTIKPLNGSQDAVHVHDKITVKKPEKDRVPSLAYTDAKNNLQRTDPSSMPLFDDEDIRSADVDTDTGEIKEPPRA